MSKRKVASLVDPEPKNKKVCSIGTCVVGDESSYNACKQLRPPNSKVDRIDLGPMISNDEAKTLVYNDTLYKRFWVWRLLQENDRWLSSRLVLSDISIHIRFTSIHTGQIGNLIGIAPWERMILPPTQQPAQNEDEEEQPPQQAELNAYQLKDHYKLPSVGMNTLLTPLLSKMRLHFYLVRICDKALAKKSVRNIVPDDVFHDVENLDDPKIRNDNLDVLAHHVGEIDCDNTGCLLKDWNFYMCYKFPKDEMRVCKLEEEDEGDSTIFDTANFAFIIAVDYMPGFFKIRKLRTKLPNNDARFINDQASYLLGTQFSFGGGQTGIPVYMSGGSIEIAYRYDESFEGKMELGRSLIRQLRDEFNILPANNNNNNQVDQVVNGED